MYREYLSPEGGRFKIVVYRKPQFFAYPGQSSDAPGKVELIESSTGRVLERTDVEMVQMVNVVEFEDGKVRVEWGIVADWNLPPAR